ncbi:uncharacterized protein BX663DRAFT_515097 [Cokeromyces recurvatus]|uniref:uncharacterized protein n=1 Tax=Cokeromyces recurvatus TaxID=90255 RepID=UPI0022202763|nr:uncharacterized protein BX663DRAFT_515097 [Cokeromyces recurvatus]KAI7901147.1 hypothetical protein BX663DRAFT_515097 [Cokeromyces recurvatus]
MSPIKLSLIEGTHISSLNNQICFTNDCINAAANLLHSLDMNIDPCSDFYQFTCGNWIKDTIIPEELAGFGILEVESMKHRERLRTIFDGTYETLLRSTLSLSSFQVTTKKNIDIDKANFKVLKNYYTSCIEINDADNVLNLATFYKDLNKLQLEITELENRNISFQINDKLFDIISYPKSEESMIIEVGGLFSIEIYHNDNNRKEMGIAIFPPSELDNINIAPLEDLSSELLYNLVSSLFSANNFTDRDRTRNSLLEDIGLKTLSNFDIYSIVDNAVSAQIELLKFSKSSFVGDFSKVYSVDDAVTLFPFIDWKSILKSNIPQNHDLSNLKININNINYFNKLQYFANINDPSRFIYRDGIIDFIIIHKIVQDASKLDKEMRDLMPDTPYQTRSSLCIDKTLDNFGLVAGRFYSMITFDGESDRLKLEEIANTIKKSLRDRIENASWLDISTRKAAIKKLNTMSTSIGYSLSFPDERSPLDIHFYLNGLETTTDNFYENEMSVIKWILQTYWGTLGRSINAGEWLGIISPQVLNAFNLLSRNSVFVSAAFAQKPNYDKHYPDYFNYGGIGQTFGHEFSHGFDDFGSEYDEFGIENNWWSEETKLKYNEKVQCFIEQYSKATITDENGEEYSIDGYLTLGENIADIEGLSAAYDAYLNLKRSGKGYNPILPGLHNYSPEALFFINAARSFCSKPLPGTVKDSLTDEHAPDSIRANKVFQNNEDFAKVFNCPIGSKMNPKAEKCKIW